MNRLNLILRQKVFIIAIILMVIFAAFLIYWYLNSVKNEKQPGGNIEIYTSKIEIKAGTRITKDMIERKSIPGNIFNQQFITDASEVSGKITSQDIMEGEIISGDKIQGTEGIKESSYLSFSSYIPAGLRAVSIPVNYYGEKSLLNIGDKVDLVSTVVEKGTDNLVSLTLLEGKEIILIDGKIPGNAPDGYGSQPEDTGISNGMPALDSIMHAGTDQGLYSTNCILTFYLRPLEVEKVFLSLQTGTINLSICPKSITYDF